MSDTGETASSTSVTLQGSKQWPATRADIEKQEREEVKRGEQGPASMQMADKILQGILPGMGVRDPVGDDFTFGAGAVESFDSTGASKAKVGPTNITMNNISPPVMNGGGTTQVVPVSQGNGQLNSAAASSQGSVPTFNAEDSGNFDLIVVKSIYNIVG